MAEKNKFEEVIKALEEERKAIDIIKSMISNMKISREEFYGAIKSTAKKI